MKKNLIALLSLLILALCFSGCNTIQTSSNGDKEPEQTVTPPTSAETAAQIQQLCAAATVIDQTEDNQKFIELTPEIKEQFFDLAQQERWDFLPNIDLAGSELSQDMSDYIYLVIAQSLVWQDYYNIDREKTPEKLSTEYVDAFLSERFGQPIPHPEPGEDFDSNVDYKGLAFDGEYYSNEYAEWAYPSLYGLSLLQIDDSNPDTTIYEVSLLGYRLENQEDDMPENAREIICSMDEAKPGFEVNSQIHVRFYFNENGVPVYLSATN